MRTARCRSVRHPLDQLVLKRVEICQRLGRMPRTRMENAGKRNRLFLFHRSPIGENFKSSTPRANDQVLLAGIVMRALW